VPGLRRYLLIYSGEQHMSKRIKLPKRIAGIKIPKGIRKGPVVKFLNTPPGQVVLAQALLVIGGAFAVDKARDNDGALHPLDTLKEAGRDISKHADVAGSKLTRAFAAAAHAFREVMESDSDDAVGHEPTDSNLEPARKKSRVRSEPPSTPH
jgi:hypothetical protein